MIKIKITLHYLPNEKVFTSDVISLSDLEFEKFLGLIKKAEKLDFLNFSSNGRDLYFSPSILKQSVISIERNHG